MKIKQKQINNNKVDKNSETFINLQKNYRMFKIIQKKKKRY